jgi:hypothetical protein
MELRLARFAVLVSIKMWGRKHSVEIVVLALSTQLRVRDNVKVALRVVIKMALVQLHACFALLEPHKRFPVALLVPPVRLDRFQLNPV